MKKVQTRDSSAPNVGGGGGGGGGYGKVVDGAFKIGKPPPGMDMFGEMDWKKKAKKAKADWEAKRGGGAAVADGFPGFPGFDSDRNSGDCVARKSASSYVLNSTMSGVPPPTSASTSARSGMRCCSPRPPPPPPCCAGSVGASGGSSS